MSWILWREEYRVGDAAIDQDHQTLFGLISSFHEAVQYGSAPNEVLRVLNELVTYAEGHFQREERIMAAHGYPLLEAHHHLHEKLYGSIYVLQTQLEKDPAAAKLQTIAFLKTWLTDHILQHDLAFAEFVRRRP